ncbi:MAG: AMP-binding protein [Planctomycetota bacterium]|jgi:long-chain-fatty-acid--[acyl-carrier-protein] ligase
MINSLLRILVKALLWLRYRIRIAGLEEVAARGTERILFLPNHPALIDPIILLAYLNKPFAPRALAVAHQVDRFCIRRLARRLGVRPFRDPVRHPSGSRKHVDEVVAACIEDMRRGENLLLYPSGHAYRTYLEDLRGNSAVEKILRDIPEARIVLVRTRGLWGSSFSWASGGPPDVTGAVKRGIVSLLASGLFFAPRRRVTIEFREPDDIPRDAGRNALNDYLERWYNVDAPHNTYVPYTIWERGKARALPEPPRPKSPAHIEAVPQSTREIVSSHLRELTGETSIRNDDDLARDLGLDSLARAELLVWLEKEFGFPQTNVDAMRTIGDVMLGACGELVAAEPQELKAPSARWFPQRPQPDRVEMPQARTITEAFLEQARRSPDRVIIADQARGEKTYRDLIVAVHALRARLTALPGERLGIMLPASVAADVAYLAALFSGKTPVMVNWTVGQANVLHSLELAGAEKVLTARALVERLTAQGTDLDELSDGFVFLEDLSESLGRTDKLKAYLKARFDLSSLRRAKVGQTAAILFTSGSETRPKAVPLTHENILTNVSDIASAIHIRRDDSMLGMLPPFHSFGLTATIVTPLVLGIRAVYYPKPTEPAMLSRITKAYGVTLLIGTPTFLKRILSASTRGELDSVRLAVTGAERCPERFHKAAAESGPQITVLEGYGVTECSPIVSVNDARDARALTIGKVLPSLEYAIVDLDRGARVERGRTGMLLVRGPSVFGGYLNYDGPEPFVEFEGRSFYRTGDLVSEDEDGVLTFRGRLKRFVKIGGEMISLPAVEAVLEPHYAADPEEKPAFAVVAGGSEENPELVLFTTRPADRPTVNGWIRQAKISALHNIRRIVEVEELPALGTGKVDYRALEAMLRE